MKICGRRKEGKKKGKRKSRRRIIEEKLFNSNFQHNRTQSNENC
jgi:hypothetical protein